MKPYRQIVNPQQQPWNRNYRRDRDRYFDDEARDFERGADYIRDDGHDYDVYQNRDYSPRNRFERDYRSQAPYAEQGYVPSRDYGYERDEYYDRAPWRRRQYEGDAVGYGNDYSEQARDFENWLHDNQRYRNLNPDEIRDHQFPGQRTPLHPNSDFSEGLYDYRQEQRFHEGRYRKPTQGRGGRRSRQRGYVDHKYHDRSDRHLEIVRPFKDPEDYTRNEFNESEGFGNHEFVYH